MPNPITWEMLRDIDGHSTGGEWRMEFTNSGDQPVLTLTFFAVKH